MNGPVLLADAGGTFTRFALADETGIHEPAIFESGTYASFAHAAEAFLHSMSSRPVRAAIAAAGPLTATGIAMTNGPRWALEPGSLKADLGVDEVLLVNDFAAVAASATAIANDHLVEVAPGPAAPDEAAAVIGPGTGLGVALLAPRAGGGHSVMAGEGGHVALAPTSEREIAIVFQLMRRFGHVKAEYILSGSGLEILFETLGELDGVRAEGRPTAGEIAERARRKASPQAEETVAIFTGWLGSFCGDVALMSGAKTIYLAGGVLPRWGGLFDTGLFRRRFAAKGSHRALMEQIPVWLITDPQAAFRGLLSLLERRP